MRSPPAAEGIACRQDEAEAPVYVPGKCENSQGCDGVDKDDENLVHVDLDQVHPQEVIEGGHEEESHSDLDESSVEADDEQGRIDQFAVWASAGVLRNV